MWFPFFFGFLNFIWDIKKLCWFMLLAFVHNIFFYLNTADKCGYLVLSFEDSLVLYVCVVFLFCWYNPMEREMIFIQAVFPPPLFCSLYPLPSPCCLLCFENEWECTHNYWLNDVRSAAFYHLEASRQHHLTSFLPKTILTVKIHFLCSFIIKFLKNVLHLFYFSLYCDTL